MLKIPAVTDTFQYVAASNQPVAPPFNNGFYYLFTGAVASAMIGEIQVSYLYEFDP